MCKAKSTVWLLGAIFWLILGIAVPTASATEATAPNSTPTDSPPTSATPTTTPPEINIENLQPIQGGQGNLPIINPYTNEIIDPSSYQPKEKTWWEKIYPYCLDVAIGVGAALVTFAVIKLVQVNKSKVKGQKSKDAE